MKNGQGVHGEKFDRRKANQKRRKTKQYQNGQIQKRNEPGDNEKPIFKKRGRWAATACGQQEVGPGKQSYILKRKKGRVGGGKEPWVNNKLIGSKMIFEKPGAKKFTSGVGEKKERQRKL